MFLNSAGPDVLLPVSLSGPVFSSAPPLIVSACWSEDSTGARRLATAALTQTHFDLLLAGPVTGNA